jgi:hypothetical protein
LFAALAPKRSVAATSTSAAERKCGSSGQQRTHYAHIAAIVQRNCARHGIRYTSQPSLRAALRAPAGEGRLGRAGRDRDGLGGRSGDRGLGLDRGSNSAASFFWSFRSCFGARFSLSSRSRFILLIVWRFAVDIRNVLSSMRRRGERRCVWGA